MVRALIRSAGAALSGLAMAAVLTVPGSGDAQAHPHVWVMANSELVFNGKKLESIRHVWQFDEAFTSFAIQGLDADGDGNLTREELQPLAKVNIESMRDFGYFTFVGVGDVEPEFNVPTQYWLAFSNGLLTLFFSLPLETPVAPGSEDLTVEVFDPTYFVDFEMIEDDPVTVSGLPASCNVAFERPRELETDMASALAEFPAEVTELPEEFMTITETLANKATVTCDS